MFKSIGPTVVRITVATAVVSLLAGCNWFGGGSSSSSSTPTAVQGIETPSSISVVSANNAN